MNHKKVAGWGLIAVVIAAFIIAIMQPANEDGWYQLVGLAMFVFAIWGGILLIKE